MKVLLCGFAVVIAGGNAQSPFRTWLLSPVVLMVLHLGGCGRVDGCRNIFVSGGPLVWGPLFLCPEGGSEGVLGLCCVCGGYTKSQGYKAPGIFTPV